MMRCLREVNADNNTVGWYQSTSLGAFQTAELADTFAAYASTIRRAVCIVVDPDAARGGGEREREKWGFGFSAFGFLPEKRKERKKKTHSFSLSNFDSFLSSSQAAASPASRLSS